MHGPGRVLGHLAAQLVRVVDEALDLTMAQNMGLPVHFMATSGDTNKHLVTGGAATYYDVRIHVHACSVPGHCPALGARA